MDLGAIFGKKSGLSGLTLHNPTYTMSRADRIRQLLSLATVNKRRPQRHKDKDKCEDRCLVHPTNRYSCGKARSRENCSDKNCCWDPNNQMCFKQVWEHCPRKRCESIHPDDRAPCAILGTNKSYGMEKCENAGCCFDSYNRQCYESSPAVQKAEPDTVECREVKASARESCGFGLSHEACRAMTGCCWRISDDSNSFCYKSALYESANNGTDALDDKGSDTVLLEVEEVEPQYPVVNLKMANRNDAVLLTSEAELVPGDKAKKFQLWMSYISALTSRIESACQRKKQPIDCIKRAANVLLVAKDEMLKSNYGLQFAATEVEAREMLEGINDVLTWFCLNHPNARFCRTLVLSGFTLSHIDRTLSSSLINEANARFSAMLKLGEYGMLGEYQPSSRTNETLRRFGTDCTNTFLLMQTYEESLAEVQSLTESNSHACSLNGGCWKKMSLRTAIVDLYGEYSRVSKAYFVSIWREAMSPLLSPPEQPLLTQTSCIRPIPTVFTSTRALFDARLDFRVDEEIPKKAGVQ